MAQQQKKKFKVKKEAPAIRGILRKQPAPKAEVPTKKAAHKKKAAPVANDRISQVMAKVNAVHGAVVIRRASATTTSHTLRRPTGVPSLDLLGLAGGWPASSLNVITGPDGAGKDYLINCTIANIQKNYGERARVAIFSTEFPYDKDYARSKCGVKVADTDEEIDERNMILAAEGLPPLTEEEVEARKEQVGEIILIQGIVMDHGLDIVLELLATGEFQLIAINSLGVMETAAKESTDSVADHATQSSEAQLLSRFMPKMFMHLNRTIEGDDDERRNETTFLVADQVRTNRDQPRGKPGMKVPEHWKYQAGSGSKALAHAKAISLMIHKGADITDKTLDPPEKLGRTINWELTKGKLGTHDGIKGSYEYFYAEGADRAEDLRGLAIKYGVIDQAGAWYSYVDEDPAFSFRVQGSDPCRTKLTNPELFDIIYRKTVTASRVVCRYT